MEWVLGSPSRRELGPNEISVRMEGSTKGRMYFGLNTIKAWGLSDAQSVDISSSSKDPHVLLLQFRTDKQGGFQVFKKTKRGGMYIAPRRMLMGAGAETARYHIKHSGKVMIVDFARDKTSFLQERKRKRLT